MGGGCSTVNWRVRHAPFFEQIAQFFKGDQKHTLEIHDRAVLEVGGMSVSAHKIAAVRFPCSSTR